VVVGIVHKHPVGVFSTGIAEFYARVLVTKGTVTGEVNGV